MLFKEGQDPVVEQIGRSDRRFGHITCYSFDLNLFSVVHMQFELTPIT